MRPFGPDKAHLEQEWRRKLLGTHPAVRFGRNFFIRLPSPPRCVLCASPFEGPFAPLFRAAGKGRFPKNPRYCSGCIGAMMKEGPGGAEIPATFLFADVRGSTPLAERLGATLLHRLMERFYETGVDALVDHGAIVDRFMGDQVVGYFVPGFAGEDHAREAVLSGLRILRDTGHGEAGGPWVPVGVGIHSGIAFVGTVGRGGKGQVELTAIGEPVNLAARLASVAATGEIMISEVAFAASGTRADPERRTLALKGISAPVAARVLTLSGEATV